MEQKKHPVELAYDSHLSIVAPGKKVLKAQFAAPAVVQAMTHLGQHKMGLSKARENAKRAVNNHKEATIHINQLDWVELTQFLSNVSLFLKAETGRGNQKSKMQQFKNTADKRLSSQEVSDIAMELAVLMRPKAKDINRNKLKRLSSQIASAGDKWAALSSLALFYPLRGVPTEVIDKMVSYLGEIHLDSFKQLMAQAVIYYEASTKGWKGLQP